MKERLSTLTDEYFNLDSASPQSLDEKWNFSTSKCLTLMYVLTKTIDKKQHLPWMSIALKRIIREFLTVFDVIKMNVTGKSINF